MTFTHRLTGRRWAILALASAGALWGLTVPLSKLGLEWLGAGSLTVARFAVAAPVLALLTRRRRRARLRRRDPAPERRDRAHQRQPRRAGRRRGAGARRADRRRARARERRGGDVGR